MGKSIGRTGLLLLAAASATAETQQTNVRNAGASFYYSRYDQFVGGKRVSASVTIQPTWPPGSPATIRYSADECTIDYCVEMWPGYMWCDCSPFSIGASGGMGHVPDGAFDVSPQGVARLSLDTAGVTWDYAYGTCESLDVTWTPNGEFHRSEDSKLAVETPTDVYRGVGRDESWQASVAGVICGVELTHEDPAWSASVERSHWVNVTRTPKP